MPWSLFITAREGTPVLLCSEGGETIAGGLNPELLRIEHEYGLKPFTASNGRSTWVGPGKWLSMADTGYLSPEELRLPYAQESQLLTRRTVAWVTTHPGEAAYLTLRKLLYMWGLYPFWNGRSQTLLGNVPTAVLLLLALSAAGQAPGLPTCTCDHVDTAALRVARRHNQLGELAFPTAGRFGIDPPRGGLPVRRASPLCHRRMRRGKPRRSDPGVDRLIQDPA